MYINLIVLNVQIFLDRENRADNAYHASGKSEKSEYQPEMFIKREQHRPGNDIRKHGRNKRDVEHSLNK